MRTDATERLAKLLGIEPPWDVGWPVEQFADAAADEIERLRAALEMIAGERPMTADETHKWWIWHGLECCEVCGIVRRADRQNRPCRGPTKIVCK